MRFWDPRCIETRASSMCARVRLIALCPYLAAAIAIISVGLGVPGLAAAADFSVTPIRAVLHQKAMSETITVTNSASTRLRVAVRLMEWTQDASGKDVYQESSDLVYFPRQMEIEPNAKRLVRVGAKIPAGGTERAYRLFIEEVPETAQTSGPSAVTFYFSFGVPIFVPPQGGKARPEVMEPRLEKGKLSLQVRNAGNQHFRVNKMEITDNVGHSQEIAGWYSLAGTSRTYMADIPLDACRKAKVLVVKVVGDGISLDREINVDPASCL